MYNLLNNSIFYNLIIFYKIFYNLIFFKFKNNQIYTLLIFNYILIIFIIKNIFIKYKYVYVINKT